jgi:hypothetical protein
MKLDHWNRTGGLNEYMGRANCGDKVSEEGNKRLRFFMMMEQSVRLSKIFNTCLRTEIMHMAQKKLG